MKAKLKKKLNDDLVKDILMFFYEHQASIDTVGGVSTWVGSDRGKVEDALDELVRLGVLEKDSMGSTNGYCYTRDKKVMKIVRGLIE